MPDDLMADVDLWRTASRLSEKRRFAMREDRQLAEAFGWCYAPSKAQGLREFSWAHPAAIRRAIHPHYVTGETTRSFVEHYIALKGWRVRIEWGGSLDGFSSEVRLIDRSGKQVGYFSGPERPGAALALALLSALTKEAK